MDSTSKARQTLQAIAEARAAGKAAKADKRARFWGNVPLALAYLMMTATFLVAAWSAYHLVAIIPGVPTLYAGLAFAAVEGAWMACVLLMVKWQHDTDRLFQFNKANRLAKQVYWGSLALNLGHGFVLVGSIVGGALAGLVLCIFPYIFKELFGVAVTNRVEELRRLGLGDVLAERYQISALARFHEQDEQPVPVFQDSKPGHQDTALDTGTPAVPITSDTPGHQVAAPALTGQDTAGTAPGQAQDDRPLSEVVRDTIKQGVPVSDLVSRVCQLRPDTKRDTIKRTVNRELSKIEQGGGYL